MNLLKKLTMKNLRLNKKRAIVTVIGIVLSVALITAVASMFFCAKASLIQFEVTQKGNFHYCFYDVPVEDVRDFELNRKIEGLFLTKQVGYAKLDGIRNEYKPYLYVSAFTKDSMDNLGIRLQEGRLPRAEGEILIPSHLKTNGGVDLKVNDTLTLDVGKRTQGGEELGQSNPYVPEDQEEITNTTTRTYTIVGIMERLSSTIEDYEAPGYTCVTYLQDMGKAGVVDVYARYTAQGIRDHETVTEGIIQSKQDPVYNYGSNGYLLMLEAGDIKNPTLKALANAALVVILIIIITSVFCIKNSFDISIAEKMRQYGMLRSIGATKRQIRKNVYYEAFLLGVFGVPIGVICGVFASFVLILISNHFLQDSLNFALIFCFSWIAVIFAAVLGFVTVFLSAGKGARCAGRVSPIRAIRNSDDVKIKSKKVQSPKWVKHLFGIGGEISYKNLKRSRKKYRTTVISIIVCVSVFIVVSSFINLGFDMIKTEFQTMNYNLDVSYMPGEDTVEPAKQALSLPDVEECVKVTTVIKEMGDMPYSKEYLHENPDLGTSEVLESFTIDILDEASFKRYVKELKLDYADVKEKGILVNEVFMYQKTDEKDKYKVVRVPMYTYQAGDTVAGIEIATLTTKVPTGISEYNWSTHLIVNESCHREIQGEDSYEGIYINCQDAAKVQGELEEIFKDVTSAHIENIEENVDMMRSFYTLVAIFLYGFITVIALIGVTNIFNTITTNMHLRRREFAMLKSVGMTRKEFNRMIRLESIFYGTKSLIIGIPIGSVLSYIIYKVLSNGAMDLGYRLPVEAIVISAAAVFVLVTVIMRYSIGKIKNQNIVETIRNENI